MTPLNAPTASGTPLPLTAGGRLELRHVEHLMDVCSDSHDGLMLLGTMAVVATVIKQRDAAEAQLLAARRGEEALRPYLQHRHDCKKCPKEIEGVLYGEALPPHECTCGLGAAFNQAEQR